MIPSFLTLLQIASHEEAVKEERPKDNDLCFIFIILKELLNHPAFAISRQYTNFLMDEVTSGLTKIDHIMFF